MKIALLVPSRERLQYKKSLVDSIIHTVSDMNNVKLYFGIDDDDPTKNDYLKMFSCYDFVKTVEIHNEGKFDGLGKLWNICARASDEEIISMIGDDMVFKTKGWDTEVLKELSPPKCPLDKIKMVYANDCRHGRRIAVNAFLNRRYMDINGYFMREEFKVDFIDLWLHQVFDALGRLVYRGDIKIEHNHWSFKKMPKDHVAQKLRSYHASAQLLWIQTAAKRREEVFRIAKVIGVNPNLKKINGDIPP